MQLTVKRVSTKGAYNAYGYLAQSGLCVPSGTAVLMLGAGETADDAVEIGKSIVSEKGLNELVIVEHGSDEVTVIKNTK